MMLEDNIITQLPSIALIFIRFKEFTGCRDHIQIDTAYETMLCTITITITITSSHCIVRIKYVATSSL